MIERDQFSTLPFSFVLEELGSLEPVVGRMFGCYSVYVGAKIVFILRSGREPSGDNGVWIATTKDHHESLKKEFTSMRSIEVFGTDVTGWQVLPEESEVFEEEVIHACKLVRKGDLRIGKIPVKKKKGKVHSKKVAAKAKVKDEKGVKLKKVVKRKIK